MGPTGRTGRPRPAIDMGLLGGVGSVGGKFVPGQNYRVDKMAETGLYEDGKKGVRRPGDPDERIKDMDRDGVDAEIIFGILGVASRVQDHEAANEMLRIYNDWLKGFCSHYPDRQIGLACLPYGDIDAAVKEVYRVAKLGLKGLELSCSWDMEPMWHPVWEPLWKAVNDVQLPLHFHTFPAMPASQRAKLTGQLRRQAQFTSVAGFQMNLINIIAAIIGAGVLERYPNLRIGLGESGIGWLPYALDRMDFEYEDRFRDLMKLKPSEYWRRQCRATFQFDRIGAKLVDDIGVETLMWGSDYPHPDGVWPESYEIHRGAVRRPVARSHPQDHLRERRQILRPRQLTQLRNEETVMKVVTLKNIPEPAGGRRRADRRVDRAGFPVASDDHRARRFRELQLQRRELQPGLHDGLAYPYLRPDPGRDLGLRHGGQRARTSARSMSATSCTSRPASAIGTAPRPIRRWGTSRSPPSAARPPGASLALPGLPRRSAARERRGSGCSCSMMQCACSCHARGRGCQEINDWLDRRRCVLRDSRFAASSG